MNMSASGNGGDGSNPIKNVIIAYHDKCLDGFTSAWVCDRSLRKLGYQTHLVPMKYSEESYGQLCEVLTQDLTTDLFIVDFSIPMNWLDSYIAASIVPGLQITIIDHHKTAIEKYVTEEVVGSKKLVASMHEKLNTGHLISIVLTDSNIVINLGLEASGAGMCWEILNPEVPVPWLVSYVQDWDLWKFKYGRDTRYVNKFLWSKNQTMKVWDDIAIRLEEEETSKYILNRGRMLVEDHEKRVVQIAAKAVPVIFQGMEGSFVSCAKEYVSEVGNKVAEANGSFCLMCDAYVVPDKQNNIEWSLRSIGDLDVSAMAKEAGGGGHKNAAGFTMCPEESRMLLNYLGVTDGLAPEAGVGPV